MCREVLSSSLLPLCSVFVVSVISIDSKKHLHVCLFPIHIFCLDMDFPGSSAGKESACNIGDVSSIPGLGRPIGEGICYPLQHPWVSLVAQLVKNPPAIREAWV